MSININQIKHLSRCINQWLFGVKIGVIGGYHGGNLGDIALGQSVLMQLVNLKKKAGLQTIYNLEKWPTTEIGIVGGGAVGYSDSLLKVATRYENNYQSVGLLGVDFNEEQYSGKVLELIKNATFVSCRSEKQALNLQRMTERKDIVFHPDIAFSLLNQYCKNIRTNRKSVNKKMLINVLPLYAKMKDGIVCPIEKYKNEQPELFLNFDQMHNSYRIVIRDLVAEGIKNGYEVETIPFTYDDELYAKQLLEGLNVKHRSYNSDPFRMLKLICSADWVVATRFHATIFALKAGVKLSPIAYATKNQTLLQDLGVNKDAYLSTSDLAKGKIDFLQPIIVNNDLIGNMEVQSENAINACIKKVLK